MELTTEQVDQHYAAAMDSVRLISQGQPRYMTDDEWHDCLERNKDHIRLMLTKSYMQDRDLTAMELALSR